VHAPPAIAYSRGQLAYAAVMAAFYLAAAGRRRPALLAALRGPAAPSEGAPRSVATLARAFGASPAVLAASAAFGWQAVQKMLLQDAGRFALSGYSARVAGVYGEVQNLGSLVVRIVFWPIESAAFRTFSRLRGDASAPTARESEHLLRLLSVLTRLVLLVALLACAFGPSYAFSAIHVLLSATWSSTEAPLVLSAYCAYLLCLAVNGVTEAYVHATATARQLALSNAFMVAATLAHAATLLLARRTAESCLLLVVADCANMALRAAFAVWCILRQHPPEERPGWGAWLPSARSLLLLAACAGATQASNRVMVRALGPDALALPRLPRAMAVHVAFGGAIACVALLGLHRLEAALMRDVRALLRPKAD